MRILLRLGLGFAAALALPMYAEAQPQTNRERYDYAYAYGCTPADASGNYSCFGISADTQAYVKKNGPPGYSYARVDESGVSGGAQYYRTMLDCPVEARNFSVSNKGAALAVVIDSTTCGYNNGAPSAYSGMVSVSGQWGNPQVTYAGTSNRVRREASGAMRRENCNDDEGDETDFSGSIGSTSYTFTGTEFSFGFFRAVACNVSEK